MCWRSCACAIAPRRQRSPQATGEPLQHVGATDLQPPRQLVHAAAEHARERDGLALRTFHRRVRGVRSGQRREPYPTHGERVREAARVGDQDATGDLGRRGVVGRDGAGGRVDPINPGVEHGSTLRAASRAAIHQRDDLAGKG
jgi:hypothetical protein